MNLELIDNINICWKQIFHSLKKSSRPILDELGLTKVDANILLALHGKKEKTKAQLAQNLSFEPNSLTRSLDRLIDLNLVKRREDQNDRRFIKVSLTEKGNRLANKYIKSMRNVWNNALHGINKREVEALDATLKKIFSNLYDEE